MALTRYLPVYVLLCASALYSSSIQASAVAVAAEGIQAHDDQFEGRLVERVLTIEELFAAGRFEEAIALLDPTVGNPRRFILVVSRTKNPDLIRAYAEKACPYRADLWADLFSQAPLAVCKAIWHLRGYSENPQFAAVLLLRTMMRAATQKDLPYFVWSLEALKEMNALHELNRTTGILSYEYKSPNSNITKHYRSPIEAAASHNQLKMVKLLLMHGSEPFWDVPLRECCDYGCKTCRGDRNSFSLLESVALRKPLIHGFIKEPRVCDFAGSNHQQKVFRALLQRREFASEYVAGQNCDTMLHAAVAAQNRADAQVPLMRKMIWLCLIYNKNLIDAKGKGGLNPVRLAAGGFFEALRVMVDFCYTVGSEKKQ